MINQTDGGGTQSKRGKLLLLRAQLSTDIASFLPHWRTLGENIFPRRPRFTVSDVNRGDRRNHKIVNTRPTLAARTLRAGMMGGITSPARPWFKLTTPDPDMATHKPIKEWLEVCDQRMSQVYLRSNLYNTLPIVYGDLGVFATAPMFIEEDFEQTIRTISFPPGSYKIAKDHRGRVNVFYREFQMSVRQIVERFGRDRQTGKIDWSNISVRVQNLYKTNMLETMVDVHHVIQPNEDFDPQSLFSKNKKFASIYFEWGTTNSDKSQTDYTTDKFLSEKGYDYFPVLCPRWEVTGEDAYGTDCPGMTALGDILGLYVMEKRKAQAIEKMVNPPMTGPASMRNQKNSILPGDITFVDSREGNGFRPAHEVRMSLTELQENIKGHEDRIDKAFFVDLFLMMTDSDRRQITATEIDERKEEKLLALGPVLEQLNQDLLDRLIDITFQIMFRQGQIPTPPQELKGIKLGVQYVSIMAQAQKMIGVSTLERFAGFVTTLMQENPQAADKVNTDELIEDYGNSLGVPVKAIRSDEEVQQIRNQRQQAQAAQAQSEQMANAAQSAKNLSQADTSGENGLTNLMDMAKAGQMAPGA